MPFSSFRVQMADFGTMEPWNHKKSEDGFHASFGGMPLDPFFRDL